MDKDRILSSSLLDILFEQRNKEYGAYELRKHYASRARKALTYVLGFLLLICSIPLLAGLGKTNPPTRYPNTPPDTLRITQINQTHRQQEHTGGRTKPPKNHNPLPTQIDHPLAVQDTLSHHDTLITSGAGNLAGNHQNNDDSGGSGGNSTANTQSQTGQGQINDTHTYDESDVQVMAEFPGGDDALLAYLSANITYPARAINSDIEGRVILSFIVNREGEIAEVNVLRSIGFGCDQEAIRVVNRMPRWKPAMNNGKAVSMYFTLPVQFKLDKE
jgi:protein TonB